MINIIFSLLSLLLLLLTLVVVIVGVLYLVQLWSDNTISLSIVGLGDLGGNNEMNVILCEGFSRWKMLSEQRTGKSRESCTFHYSAGRWRCRSAGVRGAACERSRLLVLFWGMWLRGMGPSSSSLTLGRRWKNRPSGKRAGDAQRDRRNTALQGEKTGLLMLLDMECRLLCGIKRVDADVSGQWVVTSEHLAPTLCFLTVSDSHLQWCGLWTGDEPPRLYSAFWDTLSPEQSPKHYLRTPPQKVKVFLIFLSASFVH